MLKEFVRNSEYYIYFIKQTLYKVNNYNIKGLRR